MHHAQKARVATIVVLATTLLAGCSASEPSAKAGPTSSSTVEEKAQTQGLSPEEAFREAGETSVAVTVTEVIDPRTFLVEPRSFEQENKGLSGEIEAQLRANTTLVTPAENECGYAETLTFAKEFFAENPDANIYEGNFISDTYYPRILQAGFAYMSDDSGEFYEWQMDAESSGAGLWSTCPDFGNGR
jgi:outer membrane murein-binding lipoprotein Lpp